MSRYSDFVLHFETNSAGNLLVRVLDSPAGEGSAMAGPSISAAESIRILAALAACATDESRETTEQIGAELFSAVFSGVVRVLLERSLGLLGRADSQSALRIVLRLDLSNREMAFLSKLPWELINREESGEFLALDRNISVVRRLQVARPSVQTPIDGPLKILLVVSEPKDFPSLDLNAERSAIENSLHKTDAFEVTVLTHPTLPAIREKLVSDTFHIVHFMGHGSFDAVTGEGAVVLEDQYGKATKVAGREMAATLGGSPSLRLVYLNACETARATAEDRANPFAGVATAMVRGGVPVVIAMQFPISDQGAASFSATFYHRLAFGDSIEAAITEARLALFAKREGRPEWFAPALFTRPGSDSVLRATGQEATIVRDAMAKPELPSEPFLHYSGHGSFDAATVTGEGSVVLEDQDGKATTVGIHEIAAALDRLPSLRVLVLNACASGATPPPDAMPRRRRRVEDAQVAKRETSRGSVVASQQTAVADAFESILSITGTSLHDAEISNEEIRKDYRIWSMASLVAAGLGLGMIIAALVSVLLRQPQVGFVTGIAGAVSSAVGALFFRQSQAAGVRLARMTDELAYMRAVSMAQHIAQTMETAPERDRAKAGIVKGLLAPPGRAPSKKGQDVKILCL